MNQLSEEIGGLIHLRYIDLSENPIKELPETLCNLFNLQTLDLRSYFKLTKLPRAIERLVKLKHLFIFGTHLLEYPCGFRKLTSLWTLDSFVAKSDLIRYLENLNELRSNGGRECEPKKQDSP
ncbi:hypothetical protein ACS0TY_035243 [Phlomoides rotata]